MQSTPELDQLAAVLLDIVSFLNTPQRDEVLLRSAGVKLDRALVPLLMRLGMRGMMSVAELAEQAGRDHTTVSRQLTHLDTQRLVLRRPGETDRRQTIAELTQEGRVKFEALLTARRQTLARALVDWSDQDCQTLTTLLGRFSYSLNQLLDSGVEPS